MTGARETRAAALLVMAETWQEHAAKEWNAGRWLVAAMMYQRAAQAMDAAARWVPEAERPAARLTAVNLRAKAADGLGRAKGNGTGGNEQ